MNKLFPKVFALLLLTSPAFAVRIAAPVRVVPKTGAIGSLAAVGAAPAAPRSLITPSLGNSISLNSSLTTLKTPSLTLNSPIAALSSPLKTAVPTAVEVSVAKKLAASGMHQAAAMSAEMREVEKSKSASAAPVFRKIFDNGAAAPSYAASVLAGIGSAVKNPLGRLLHNDRPFQLDRVPSPERGESPKQSGWKQSGWWKTAKAVAAVSGGLFLGSKAADFAYAFALAPAGVWGLAGLAAAGGLAAWGLRKLSNKRGAQLFYSTLLGTLLFNAGGNLLADTFGIGLMSFAIASPIALAALLWAAGVGLKKT